MVQFYYNRLRNNRIKGISLGLVVILANALATYLYYVLAGKDNVSVFIVVIISFISIGLFYLLGLIDFGQIIEKNTAGQISTFYRLGPKKLKFKTLGEILSTELTQDKEKHYCLTVETTNGHVLVLEKHATANEANERLEELRMTIT